MTTPAFDHKALARFWAKVDKNGPFWNGTRCWVWKNYVDRDGYGNFWYGGKNHQAHRISLFVLYGAKQLPGLNVDHLCRNRSCVNPQHLEQVTSKVNTLRGQTPAAFNALKTCCPKGHPYDEANTYRVTEGRSCLICRRQKSRDWMRKYRLTEVGTISSRKAIERFRLRKLTLIKPGDK